MDEYENLVKAIGMIDGAIAALEEADTQDEAVSLLHGLRNDLNVDRVACLGNGADRPFHVADLKLT